MNINAHKRKPDVLILNTAWIPIHIVDWQTGMSLIYTEKCKPLDREYISYTFADWLQFSNMVNADNYPHVNTVNFKIAVPEIIVSTTFDKLPDRKVKFSRMNVFSRDKYRCGYCGKQFTTKNLTVDHIIPREKGGTTNWDNVISCCFPCNQKKSNKLLHQCGMKLRIKPKKPKWVSPLYGVNIKIHPCKSWEHFMLHIDTKAETDIVSTD